MTFMAFRRKILLSNVALPTDLVSSLCFYVLIVNVKEETRVFKQNQLLGFRSKIIGNLG